MRLYAFAALLAFPIVWLSAPAAKADYYCCGTQSGYPADEEFLRTRHFYVDKDAVVFGCDGYHCETNITLEGGIVIKAGCRNGWCEIRSLPFKNAWVLESCLTPKHHGHGGYPGPDDRVDEPYRRPY